MDVNAWQAIQHVPYNVSGNSSSGHHGGDTIQNKDPGEFMPINSTQRISTNSISPIHNQYPTYRYGQKNEKAAMPKVGFQALQKILLIMLCKNEYPYEYSYSKCRLSAPVYRRYQASFRSIGSSMASYGEQCQVYNRKSERSIMW